MKTLIVALALVVGFNFTAIANEDNNTVVTKEQTVTTDGDVTTEHSVKEQIDPQSGERHVKEKVTVEKKQD